MEAFLQSFVFFFSVIDPIGTVPVFVAATTGLSVAMKRRIAIKSFFVALSVLIFFIVVGEVILTAINVPLAAFQISGGIILFLFALTMIFGDAKPQEEIRLLASKAQTAVFPLAIPSIASPGAILAAVMLTEKDRFNLAQQAVTTFSMLLVLMLTLLLMLLATGIYKVIGETGSAIVSRVMGMILSSLAVTQIIEGLQFYLNG